MRGTIFLPHGAARGVHPSDAMSVFAETLAARYNFKLVCDYTLPLDQIVGNILFTIKAPQYSWPDALGAIEQLPKNIKFVTYLQDLYTGPQQAAALARADCILFTYKASFARVYPEFLYKGVHLPLFLSPAERYFSMTPLSRRRKCLLTGATYYTTYPLRHEVASNPRELFEVLKHPGYDISGEADVCVGEDYAKRLSAYLCSFTTIFRESRGMGGNVTGHANCITYKHLEIPACGTLLITDWCDELDEFGFQDMENYVMITPADYRDAVRDVLENPEYYEPIAKAGRVLIRRCHTLEQRLEILDAALFD